MKQTLRLGRVAGVPVGVHWSVLGIMVLLVEGLAVAVLPGAAGGLHWSVYWAVALVGAVLFLLSLLAHEMAHAALARRYGIRVERVTLWLLGGVAEFGDEPPSARADMAVAAIGPLTSFVAGVVFGGFAFGSGALGLPPVLTAALAWLAFVNVILAVFNLLPGAPLDGGRVLRAILWQWRGDRDWAAQTAAKTGYVLGLLLIAAGIAEALFAGLFSGIWLALIGWFLVSASNAERAAARAHSLLSKVPVRAVMSTDLVCGKTAQSIDDFVAEVANERRHHVYPVTDDGGHPTGVVMLGDLSRVPVERRHQVSLTEVAVPMSQVPVIEPGQTVGDVAPTLAGGGIALVVADTVLIGVMSSEDVSKAAEMAELSAPLPR